MVMQSKTRRPYSMDWYVLGTSASFLGNRSGVGGNISTGAEDAGYFQTTVQSIPQYGPCPPSLSCHLLSVMFFPRASHGASVLVVTRCKSASPSGADAARVVDYGSILCGDGMDCAACSLIGQK